MALLPTPQLVSCHGNPFGSVFGFSWKSLKVLVCSWRGVGTFSDAFRGFVGMAMLFLPSSCCECCTCRQAAAGIAAKVKEQLGGAQRLQHIVCPVTFATSNATTTRQSLALSGEAHPFPGSSGYSLRAQLWSGWQVLQPVTVDGDT